jgi:hypothetical protein
MERDGRAGVTTPVFLDAHDESGARHTSADDLAPLRAVAGVHRIDPADC